MKSLFPVALLLLVGGAFSLRANPTGGAVANGSATIAGEGSSAVTINQASNTAIINWQTFSIGSGELTKFVQPSSTSATLNRVLGGQTSFLNGTLSANGQIYLLNGNGIVVGPGGVINTAGFTGSTRDISDVDFLSGNLHFVGSGGAGVRNLGTINALGGDVVLIGKTVRNKGTINAAGTAGLVAGDDVLLAQKNADGSTITVNPVSAPGATRAKVGVRNSGTITASSAELKAANGNIYALAIQNEGVVRASTVTRQGGHIFLTSDSGTVVNSGTLDASATAAHGQGGTILVKSATGRAVHSGKIIARGGQGGTGGRAEVSGAQLGFTGTVDLTAAGGTFGNLLLDPATLNVITGGGGAIVAGQNNGASTIDPAVVDAALNMADVTLNADNTITITNGIAWNSASTLTLSTNTAGSTIRINAPISDTYTTAPTGGLTIQAAGAGDVISTSTAGTIQVPNFILASGAWRQLVNDGSNGGNLPAPTGNQAATLPAFAVSNDFEIQGGSTFLRALGGNGGDSYYQLNDVYGLQGVGGFLGTNFTNNTTIDATVTSTWNGGAGFVPIGSVGTPYTGAFSYGTVQYLTINRPNEDDIGLFSVVGPGGSIFNIDMSNSNITGGTRVGSIAGTNLGSIQYSYAFGGSVTGDSSVGGFAGLNGQGATIEGGLADVNVTGTTVVGGVAGENDGTVDNATGSAIVTGISQVGGIAGLNTASDSYTGLLSADTFSGTVTGNDEEVNSSSIGGIAGQNDGTIDASNTVPSATVTGNTDVGGLAGYNTGTISNSYNSGGVNGVTNVGGVAGENEGGTDQVFSFAIFQPDAVINQPTFRTRPGLVLTSYNNGAVGGDTAVGGLVGLNDSTGTVNTCYNVGAVTGDDGSSNIGGLAGDNYGTVKFGYNSGTVSGTTNTAALIGFDEDGAITTNLYWDTTTSGVGLTATNRNDPMIDNGAAAETYIGTVDGTSAYTVAANNSDPASGGYGAGYGYLGAATLVAGSNSVYRIGTSPDPAAEDGPAWYIVDTQTRPLLGMEYNQTLINAHQMQLIDVNLQGSYTVTQSFSFSGTRNSSEIWNSSVGFSPIGMVPVDGSAYAFDGALDGGNLQLDALYINRPTTDNVGLFGYTASNASVSSVYLANTSVTGLDNVGGVVGNNSGTVIYAQNAATTLVNQPVFNVRGNGNNIGGIVGLNQVGSENLPGTVTRSINGAFVEGATGSSSVGGIVGSNAGMLTESINSGRIGTGGETEVGGLAGDNSGTVANSYGTDAGTIHGETNVGGLVGHNGTGAIFETSYSTSAVTGSDIGADPTTTGALVGTNDGTARHAYWQTDNSNGALPGIGTQNNVATDIVGYTRTELADIHNYAQGESPALWDFSPQVGEGSGVWGINVFTRYFGAPINDGLPVLQWQTPVSVEVVANSGNLDDGSLYYGAAPAYTVIGNGATSLFNEVPGGPTVTLGGSQDVSAGTTHPVTLTGTPNDFGYNIEYVNGVANIVPAPLTITANNITIPQGQDIPPFTATYSPFAYNENPSDLAGTLQFTPALPASTVGRETITPFGQSSSNYAITYISGTLNITGATPGENQQVATVESEITSVVQQFGNDPFNGLDPLYFTVIPTKFRLGGDLIGAVNNEGDPTDLAYGSSTSSLPALSRLVTPGTGVVTMADGTVIVGCPETGAAVSLNGSGGGCLPGGAILGLRGVLSPSVAHQLQPLLYGHP